MLWCNLMLGSSFQIIGTYMTKKGTGTGEIVISITTQDGIPLGNSLLVLPQNPGNYSVSAKGEAKPDPDCDPTQGPCEMWLPGNYSVDLGKH